MGDGVNALFCFVFKTVTHCLSPLCACLWYDAMRLNHFSVFPPLPMPYAPGLAPRTCTPRPGSAMTTLMRRPSWRMPMARPTAIPVATVIWAPRMTTLAGSMSNWAAPVAASGLIRLRVPRQARMAPDLTYLFNNVAGVLVPVSALSDDIGRCACSVQIHILCLGNHHVGRYGKLRAI